MRRVNYDSDEDHTEGTDWGDEGTRRHFISKVLTIIAFQMAFTAAITCGVLFIDPAKSFFLQYWYMCYIGTGGMIVISFILYCCRSLARHPIVGSVLLFLYTIFATILVCSVTVYYEINLDFWPAS
ncbi:uncharacterized protein LOC111596311 isoform X2 [Drosophila hydei]|uniref:Uncharacterized protein LOC111596311 isoform X2 n=1 Tax=Drosophila hydei TaxID=7224 RepID=A0A6J1LN52_DROHY|nr:uncharacterized protein LOC111596311 isoform X2 [Drosophila hydei]